MKTWNLQVENSPNEIIKKLESSLGHVSDFVLKMNSNRKDFVKFKIRKRVLLAFEINAQNNIVVSGEISKANDKNETDVDISFTEHPLSKLLIYGHIILGLLFLMLLILKASSNSYMLLIGGILIVIGILLGLHLKRNFDRNVQEYKTLISGILEIEK